MCDMITCMKEYNAAALFNLCFLRRQMFEFVRMHGKICNNKTISAFVSTKCTTACSYSLSFSFSDSFLYFSWHRRENVADSGVKLCFTFCHFNILLLLSFCHFCFYFCLLTLAYKTKLQSFWWDIRETKHRKLSPPYNKTYKHPFNICKQRVRQFIANKQTTCWIFIYFCMCVCVCVQYRRIQCWLFETWK